jgi:hypothetical protein
VEGISNKQMADIILPATRYGFHGTLKPPFHLHSQESESSLIKDLKHFVDGEEPFVLSKLQLTEVGRFIALVPQQNCSRLHSLAERCVRFFDAYRKPESTDQMNRRRSAGLNPLQEEYLVAWGYPYVLKEFRFHMTLTGPFVDENLKKFIFRELENRLTAINLGKIMISSICLFTQKETNQAFLFHSRHRFTGDDSPFTIHY